MAAGQVKIRVREHRSVYVDGVLYRAGDEVTVPVEEADALIEQRFAEKPGSPLDEDDVRAAEVARAFAESEAHRDGIDRRMARAAHFAKERQEQDAADEDARRQNAYERHLATARGTVAGAPERLRSDEAVNGE